MERMVFSEEIYNAMKYGYKFKVLKGYLFDKQVLFKDYVEQRYNIKHNSAKGSPFYLISKYLMKSLYGRFGMSPYLENHIIVDDSNNNKYINKTITNVVSFGNGKELLTILDPDKQDSRVNISIPIALATTAYNIIYMANLKWIF